MLIDRACCHGRGRADTTGRVVTAGERDNTPERAVAGGVRADTAGRDDAGGGRGNTARRVLSRAGTVPTQSGQEKGKG